MFTFNSSIKNSNGFFSRLIDKVVHPKTYSTLIKNIPHLYDRAKHSQMQLNSKEAYESSTNIV